MSEPSPTTDSTPPHRYTSYLAGRIEAAWQARWAEEGTFEAPNPVGALSDGFDKVADQPKLFVMDMFPYPSGAGLHVGHPLGYIGTDVYARYHRMTGHNVMHTMGYDAFGLPAEQVAELDAGTRAPGEGTNPTGKPWAELSPTERRVVVDNHRLAYVSEAPVNWCPGLGTVLANEEVTAEGRSERGNFPVFRRPLRQWMLRITAYADRLVRDLDKIDWPEPIKQMQRNWIGRSKGARVTFPTKRG